jgi:hypothetical protein
MVEALRLFRGHARQIQRMVRNWRWHRRLNAAVTIQVHGVREKCWQLRLAGTGPVQFRACAPL